MELNQDLHQVRLDLQRRLADLHQEVALHLDRLHHQEVVVDHLQDLLVEAEDAEDKRYSLQY